jgi:hypothetical protein
MSSAINQRRTNIVFDGRLEDNYVSFLDDLGDHLGSLQLSLLMNDVELSQRIIAPSAPAANASTFVKSNYERDYDMYSKFVRGYDSKSLSNLIHTGITIVKEHLGPTIKNKYHHLFSTIRDMNGTSQQSPNDLVERWKQILHLIRHTIKPKNGTDVQNINMQMDNITDDYGIRFILAFLAEYQSRLSYQYHTDENNNIIMVNGTPLSYAREDTVLKSIVLKNIGKNDGTSRFVAVKQYFEMNPDASYQDLVTKINNVLKSSSTSEDEVDPLGANYDYEKFKAQYLKGKSYAVYAATNPTTSNSNSRPNSNNNNYRTTYNSPQKSSSPYVNNKRGSNEMYGNFSGNCANCRQQGHKAIDCQSTYCHSCKRDFYSIEERKKHVLEKHASNRKQDGGYNSIKKRPRFDNQSPPTVYAKTALRYADDTEFQFQQEDNIAEEPEQYDAEQFESDDATPETH